MAEGMNDRELDDVLHGAGARWRERNPAAAAVDLAAATTMPARRAGDPAPDPDSAKEALPLLPEPGGRARRRRTRTGLAAVAAAAAVAGLTVGLLQLTGGSSGGRPTAAGTPGASAPANVDLAGAAVIGPDWQLTGLTGPDGTAATVATPAHLRISGGKLDFSDGCNSGGGTATVTGSTIAFGRLMHTEMACASTTPALAKQQQLIDAVIAGSVHWAVRGGTLTLSKPGTGTLSYTAAPATPAVDPDSVFAGTWVLQTVQPGNNVAQPYGTAVSAPPDAHVSWGADGLTGSDGCNSFRAGYHYAGTGGAGSLTISDFVTVPPVLPCPSLPSQVSEILQGATHWAVADGRLTLTDAHGGTLTFSAPNR